MWWFYSQVQVREAAQAEFDAAIAACEAQEAEARESTDEGRDAALAALQDAIEDGQLALDGVDEPVDEIADAHESLSGAVADGEELLDADPVETTEECVATPDPILTDAEERTFVIAVGITPNAEELTQQTDQILDAIDALDAALLDVARDELSAAVEDAEALLLATEWRVADNSVRVALQELVEDAVTAMDDEGATAAELERIRDEMETASEELLAAEREWTAAQAAAASVEPEPVGDNNTGTSGGTGGSSGGGGASGGNSSGGGSGGGSTDTDPAPDPDSEQSADLGEPSEG